MKRYAAILLALLICLPSFAQRPKVGVVLCGGGAKGAAHVGVLKVLEENDIPIDYIVGTSIGAIVGGLYSIGYSADELDSLFISQNWDVVMSDRVERRNTSFDRKRFDERYQIGIPFGKGDYSRLSKWERREEPSLLSNIPMALVSGQNIYNLFTKLSVGYQDSLDFNKMPIPFACVAVDLVKKEEVVFHSGRFVDAIRASMAIPGYFAPVMLDDKVLIDGGALNNYPVDVAREMGADIIIGVKLGEYEQPEPVIENIGDVLNGLVDLYMQTKFPEAIAHTDILIAPSVKGFNTLSFDPASLRTLIDNGRAAALEKQDEIAALKARLDKEDNSFVGPQPAPVSYAKAVRMDRDTITLRAVSFNGLSEKEMRVLLSKSCFVAGARLTGEMIEEEISRLYNTSAFESVTYSLSGSGNPYDLELNFVPGRKSLVGLGFNFDSEEIAAIHLNVGFNERALYGHKLTLSSKLSYNMQAGIRYSYAFKSLAQYNFSYKYRASDLNIFDKGLRSNLSFGSHTLRTDFSTRLKQWNVNLGTRLDFYDYGSLLTDAETLPIYDTDLSRKVFWSAFGTIEADRRDQQFFPTRGYELSAGYSYYFNRLLDAENRDFGVAQIHFSGVIPAGRHLSFIATVDNRTLLGGNIPMVYANTMGGYQAGRYLEHQLPFIGFTYTHVFKNILTIASLDARYSFLENHYVFASASFSQDSEGLSDLLSGRPVYGARLGYAYNSAIGPVAVNLFWSDYTGRAGAYVSLGYNF